MKRAQVREPPRGALCGPSLAPAWCVSSCCCEHGRAADILASRWATVRLRHALLHHARRRSC
eukprot:6206056-Pleurochrysis_carterae.AAC.8